MRLDLRKNLGPLDRVLRVVMGAFLTALVFAKKVRGTGAVITNVFAGVMFFQAATAY